MSSSVPVVMDKTNMCKLFTSALENAIRGVESTNIVNDGLLY